MVERFMEDIHMKAVVSIGHSCNRLLATMSASRRRTTPGVIRPTTEAGMFGTHGMCRARLRVALRLGADSRSACARTLALTGRGLTGSPAVAKLAKASARFGDLRGAGALSARIWVVVLPRMRESDERQAWPGLSLSDDSATDVASSWKAPKHSTDSRRYSKAY